MWDLTFLSAWLELKETVTKMCGLEKEDGNQVGGGRSLKQNCL